MSNPSVIVLSRRFNGQNIIIEDNIGESIHIHYGSFRLSLTIDQFKLLTLRLRNTLDELNINCWANISSYDPTFLLELNDSIFKIKCIKREMINIDDISFIENGFFLKKTKYFNTQYYKSLINKNDRYSAQNKNKFIYSDCSKYYDSLEKFIPILYENNLVADGKHGLIYMLVKKKFNSQILCEKIYFKKFIWNKSILISNLFIFYKILIKLLKKFIKLSNGL